MTFDNVLPEIVKGQDGWGRWGVMMLTDRHNEATAFWCRFWAAWQLGGTGLALGWPPQLWRYRAGGMPALGFQAFVCPAVRSRAGQRFPPAVDLRSARPVPVPVPLRPFVRGDNVIAGRGWRVRQVEEAWLALSHGRSCAHVHLVTYTLHMYTAEVQSASAATKHASQVPEPGPSVIGRSIGKAQAYHKVRCVCDPGLILCAHNPITHPD